VHHEFGVSTDGDFAAVIHHHDAVRFEDGGQPMGNDDGGAALHEFLECFLHQPFGFGVQ
jgi:hypothetical protein